MVAVTSVAIPTKGTIPLSEHVKKVLCGQTPLERLALALEDWGQSPWRVQRIVSEAALLLERNSSDADKKALATLTRRNIGGRIRQMKDRYNEIANDGEGQNDPAAKKLADDINFMETMYAFINSQINGLVSMQKSWKARSEALNKRYEEQLRLKGIWDTAKKHVPWLGAAVGAGVGVVAAWASDGWDAIVRFLQYEVKLLHSNQELHQYLDPIVKLLVNLTGIFGFGGITSWIDKRHFKRKQALLTECENKQMEIINEEKLERRKIIALMKNKALFLTTMHGYALELEKEDAQLLNLMEKKDFEGIKQLHNERVRKVLGGDIPEYLLSGAEADSRSTDLSAVTPLAEQVSTKA